ncbi:MAG: coenzyme F420-0:L-glutamate ligase [Actinomycetota bacterium]|nr:coenzyme F420-0:L-glutamate ligase [Actinomycetota bacterium]
MISISPIRGIPEVRQGDDLAALIVRAAGAGAIVAGDVVVVAQKAVSKAEGRVVETAAKTETAIAESHRILRRSGDMVISETPHGFVCANAGVDASNVEPGHLVLLPLDPDLSARRLRARLRVLCDVDVAVVISDTFGRPWRIGQTDVAIGVAGLEPFIDYRGRSDSYGNELQATQICVADELAGAAELAMGKTNGVCAAIVRGATTTTGRGSAKAIVRPPREDLFR